VTGAASEVTTLRRDTNANIISCAVFQSSALVQLPSSRLYTQHSRAICC